MKLAASFAALLALTATPVLAQTAPAPAAPAAPASTARLNLDTPIETIVADADGKKVLDADLPGLSTHAQYDMFKGMSLTQLKGMAPDKLTDERMTKVATDLAVIK